MQRLETLGQLTSGIAHAFNNIVSIVFGYSEMARDNTLEGSRTRYNIEEALKAGYRAKDLLPGAHVKLEVSNTGCVRWTG